MCKQFYLEMSRYLIWQILIIGCFASASTTIQRDTEKEICSDFICTRQSLKTETRTFVEDVSVDEGRQIECKKCDQCTDSGYSVCLRPKNTADQCLCAQEIPR
jgi:hypothetical protein